MNTETKRDLRKIGHVYAEIAQIQMEDYFYKDFIVFSLDSLEPVKKKK